MRPEHLPTFPRSLHPGAWWLWAVGLAAAASRTQNPVPLLMIVAVTGFVVAARRGDAPWARSYVAFLKLSLVVIAMRTLFQSLLSTGAQGPTVLFTLPSLPLPEDSGLKLGGVVSLEAVLRAFYEIGVACVIALTFAPQLVSDAARIRAAHRLRGQSGGLGSLKRLAVPVLEGALERSVDVATVGILVGLLPAVLAPPLPVDGAPAGAPDAADRVEVPA